MSVQVLDNEIYQKIYVKIMDYTERTTCDINFCHTFAYFDEKQAKEFILNLLYLNELSWHGAYEPDGEPDQHEFLNLKAKGTPIGSIQMYKYLQCVGYNIEINTAQKSGKIEQSKLDSYNLLKPAIASIANSIIQAKTNYEKLHWSNF